MERALIVRLSSQEEQLESGVVCLTMALVIDRMFDEYQQYMEDHRGTFIIGVFDWLRVLSISEDCFRSEELELSAGEYGMAGGDDHSHVPVCGSKGWTKVHGAAEAIWSEDCNQDIQHSASSCQRGLLRRSCKYFWMINRIVTTCSIIWIILHF